MCRTAVVYLKASHRHVGDLSKKRVDKIPGQITQGIVKIIVLIFYNNRRL